MKNKTNKNNDSNRDRIFVIKEHIPPTPKQESRINELENCVVTIKKELETIENEADIQMYASMIKEYKQIIYELKNQ